ncbi:MAG: hypothetical protein M3N28_02080 [Actinomycetota bacterium]|nr:hypothetical protein [Actinomycetota bacterium]
MPHRMDVELTSERDDGTWTWRAAGAKKPKGVVDAALLYEGARLGDVVRVDADVELDGISITSVLPPKDKERPAPRRLEVIGPPAATPRPASSPVDRGAGGPPRRPRRDGAGARPEGRDGKAKHGGHRAPPDEQRRDRGERGRPARAEGDRRNGRERRPGSKEPNAPGARRGSKRLTPGNEHRAAALAALAPEQRPVAEQVLRGGIAAVRQAVEAQNAERRAQGEAPIKADALVAMAESLLSQLKAAEWRDRAEAAAKSLDEVSIRDLRSVVAGADAAARDDETRLLASTLRQALEARLAELRRRWEQDISSALDDGRVVEALRLAGRPPDPAGRVPAELAARLSEAAGAAMAPDADPQRWSALLAAVADSPVRRSVKPAGLPDLAGEELMHRARQASARVPALAPLLGIDMPPPPGPPRRRLRPPPPPSGSPSPPASPA